VAVLRDPQQGFDGGQEYSPAESYQVVDTQSGEVVHTAAPQAWNGGATAENSGDRVWHLDFSVVTRPGSYMVVDTDQQLRSPTFRIADDIYRPVLVQAVRSFYYQRAGFAKQEPYADARWADGASHLGAGQDPEARLFNDTGNAATQRDLRGGWFDAGDYNKYTNWHATYLTTLLHSYREKPGVWTDDFNIPESGNGIPDLLDEVKWGMDWLVRMQEDNGSVLSVMGLDHASPPSAASKPSTYGPATTAATYSSAAAFALGSEILGQVQGWEDYAADLSGRAEAAWQWAQDNPSVTFRNSDNGVAAGEQEVDDYGRFAKGLIAATYLYQKTGNTAYREHVEDNYQRAHLIEQNYASVWESEIQHALLYFATLDGVSTQVADDIRSTYGNSLDQGGDNWPAVNSGRAAYRAHLQVYTWGSNRTHAHKGNLFYDQYQFGAGGPGEAQARNAALRHLNYLHGVNPLGKAYLSNMGEFGAENSVGSFYHSWFSEGSPQWSSVSDSSYGPAPGFLVGGPNPSYDWDNCCPASCGSPDNNARCGTAPPSPPAGQPSQKSYRDFNTGWPVNSWAVTENHNDYQVAYIRLLSKFVPESGN